ncbi:MAG: hypothetical protein LBE79_02325 [Tannerella sp.]|nr:hypothetical protein [Tannerella sp.]
MKQVFLFTVSLMVIGLMTGCGGKNETFVYESEGITVTFDAPAGFFTTSTERADLIAVGTGSSDKVAYVGETYTMELSTAGTGIPSVLRDKDVTNPLYQETEKANVLDGVVLREFIHQKIRYAMMVTTDRNYFIYVDFSPNDIKRMPLEEIRQKEAENIQKCTKLSTDQALLAIMKSLKITRN